MMDIVPITSKNLPLLHYEDTCSTFTMELEIKIVAIARVNATAILLQNFHFVNPF